MMFLAMVASIVLLGTVAWLTRTPRMSGPQPWTRKRTVALVTLIVVVVFWVWVAVQ